MRFSLFTIKLVHSIVFWLLSACVAYSLFCGFLGPITTWTWVAVGLLLLESLVLAIFGGRCPLTILAEKQGAHRGSVADIFLPDWLADRIFPVCGTLFIVALAAIAWRLLV